MEHTEHKYTENDSFSIELIQSGTQIINWPLIYAAAILFAPCAIAPLYDLLLSPISNIRSSEQRRRRRKNGEKRRIKIAHVKRVISRIFYLIMAWQIGWINIDGEIFFSFLPFCRFSSVFFFDYFLHNLLNGSESVARSGCATIETQLKLIYSAASFVSFGSVQFGSIQFSLNHFTLVNN